MLCQTFPSYEKFVLDDAMLLYSSSLYVKTLTLFVEFQSPGLG